MRPPIVRRILDILGGSAGLLLLVVLGPLLLGLSWWRCRSFPLERFTFVGGNRRSSADQQPVPSNRRRILLPGPSIQIWRFRWFPTNCPTSPRTPLTGFLLGLPMAWSLLKGDVSLFGPHLLELESYLFLKSLFPAEVVAWPAKPGILGLSQLDDDQEPVPGMLRRKLQLDREYLARQTPWLDLKILFFRCMEFLPGARP